MPEPLAAIVHRMLAKDPAERFATPAEVAEAIALYAEGSDLAGLLRGVSAGLAAEPRAAAVRSPRSLPRRMWSALLAVGAVAVVLLGVVLVLSTAKGTVRLEFSDAEAARHCTVTIDGDEIRIERLGEPLRLRTGKHELRIVQGEREIETREFTVVRGGEDVLRVAFAGKGDADSALSAKPEYLAEMARGLAVSGKHEEAIAILRKLVRDFPDAVEYRDLLARAYGYRGDALRAKRDWERAIASYEEAIRLQPQTADYRYWLADALCSRSGDYANKGEFERAIKGADQAIDFYPRDPVVHHLRAHFHLYLGNRDCDASIRDLTRAIHLLSPTLIKEIPSDHLERFGIQPLAAYVSRAHAYRLKHDLEQAISDYTEAIELYPAPGQYWQRGDTYRQKGDFVAATADFTHAIELLSSPPDPSLAAACYYSRALCHRSLSRAHDALADIQAGDQQRPVEYFPMRVLAWCLATCPDPAVRDPVRAVQVAKEAVSAARRLPPWDYKYYGHEWTVLGVAQYRAGNWQEAIGALNRAVELVSGGDPCDWLFLAMAHWQCGKKREARKWSDKADQWMTKNRIREEELTRFRAEAARLLDPAGKSSPRDNETPVPNSKSRI